MTSHTTLHNILTFYTILRYKQQGNKHHDKHVYNDNTYEDDSGLIHNNDVLFDPVITAAHSHACHC